MSAAQYMYLILSIVNLSISGEVGEVFASGYIVDILPYFCNAPLSPSLDAQYFLL